MRTTCCMWGSTGLLGLVLVACASQPAAQPAQPQAEQPPVEQPEQTEPDAPEAEGAAVTPEELCKRLQELRGKDVDDTSRCVEELQSRRLQDNGVYDAYAVCVIAAESTEAADACEQ